MIGPNYIDPVGEEVALGLSAFWHEGTDVRIPTYAEEQLEYYRWQSQQLAASADAEASAEGQPEPKFCSTQPDSSVG